MNKIITAGVGLVGATALGAALISAPAGADPLPVHIQASSTFTQFDGGTVEFDSVDSASGVELQNGDEFQVVEGGVYFIVAAPQVGSIEQASKGCADFWLSVNGADVANSNVQWCDNQQRTGDVIVSQGVGVLSAGDRVQVEWSTTGPAIEAIQPDGEPLVPSIIFSLFKVS